MRRCWGLGRLKAIAGEGGPLGDRCQGEDGKGVGLRYSTCKCVELQVVTPNLFPPSHGCSSSNPAGQPQLITRHRFAASSEASPI